MEKRLYATGQIVGVAYRSLSGPRTEHHFRVVGCYLMRDRAPMYHVRSTVGRGQRMVPEDELSVIMPNVFDRAHAASKILHLFPQVVRFDRGATR